MRRIYSCVLFLFLSCSLWAQEVYTLEQCKELASKNNLKAQQSKLNLVMVTEQRKEAFTNFFPVVSASGMWFKSSEPLIDMQIDLQPLLPAPIPVSVLDNGLVGSIMAVQPVFAGGRIVNGNKLAKVGEEVGQLQLQQINDNVSLQTEQYYYNIISLKEKRKTIDILDKQLTRITQDVQNSYDAGLCNRNDLLSVQLKKDELYSNRLKIENGITISQMLLAQYIGIQKDSFVVDSNLVSELSDPESLYIEPQIALDTKVEYQLLNKNIEAGELQKKMKVGTYFPNVAIGAGLVYNNLMKDFTDEDQSFGMIFASVSIPISDWWGGSHAIRAQNAKLKMAQSQKEEGEQMLLIHIQQVYNELLEAYSQTQVANRSVITAEENFRLNNDYYQAGTVTLSDLLDAQSQLQQCRDKYTDSVVTYLVKRIAYLQTTGQDN